ncbi:MAG: TIGR03826 family flagellar region protein [Halanaerobiales bacterium]
MAEIKNCPKCGKLFSYDGVNKLCEVCRQEEETDFQKVKTYLWDNPNATIEEVHEKTGVKRERIIKFIREDRLIAEGLEITFDLECERCGTPIQSGRFCERCKKELVDGFSGDEKENKKSKKKKKDTEIKQTGEMYTRDRIRRRKR